MTELIEIKITDEEWQKFLNEEYDHVIFCKPEKEVTEKYLSWKERQKESN